MAKKKRSPLASIVALVIFAAVFIFGAAVFGVEETLEMLGMEGDIELPAEISEVTGNVQPAAEEISGSGSYYNLYFTNPVIPFNDVTTGGPDTNLIALIDGAQSTIDLAVFEFNLQQIADALIAAHNRGVQVRVVHDDEHTEDDPQIEELIAAGIPAVPDERSAFMHNKFWVFDGQVVWTGSTNITENGFYRNSNNAIAIRSTRLAQNYTVEFEEMFNGEFGPRSPANTPNPQVTLNGVLIENYFAPEDDVVSALVNMISQADTSIHFMAFSFTQDTIGQAVRDRGAAGVEVRGIFEQRGAATEFSECNAFLAQGFDVRIDGNPRTFHHKVIIVDGEIVASGSFNFSANATESNDENVVIIHDPEVAQQFEAEFNRQMANAQDVIATECRVADDG